MNEIPGHLFVMTAEDRQRAETFAEKVVETTFYDKRNGQKYEKNPKVQIEQQIGSKLAELAVERYITSLGIYCTSPDFSIYTKRKKSWKPDLSLSDGTPIH